MQSERTCAEAAEGEKTTFLENTPPHKAFAAAAEQQQRSGGRTKRKTGQRGACSLVHHSCVLRQLIQPHSGPLTDRPSA